MFKIRSKLTGFYSLGGASPQFSKNGKAFPDMRAVKLHYNVVTTSGGRHQPRPDMLNNVYHACELVEFEVTEVSIHEIIGKVNE